MQVGSRTVRIQQRLGNGAFGVVYKVKDVSNSRVYALKDVLCLNASALSDAVSEATTLKKISHQNVIAVMEADKLLDSEGFTHMLILTEYCSGGSLNDRLARPSSEEMNTKWICQTAAALAHLHSHGLVHCDLKADNVLLTATEDVKLADFGLAREYTALKRIDVKQDDGSWLKSYIQYYMNSGVFPVHWVAPEIFAGRYTEKADVFSLGTLFFAILERDFIVIAGKAIYGAYVNIRGVGKLGLGRAMAEVNSGISITFSSRAQGSNALQRVVLEALQYDKNDRPSAQEIYDKVMKIRQDAVNLPSTVRVGSRTVGIKQRLGNGAFGVVYKVKDRADSTVYALKDVLCLNASALHNAVREATTLNKISHQNVIDVMGADQLRENEGFTHMLLLTEYCSGGSLNDRLARPSSEEMNVKWICQTAAALAHLHSQGVVHRDLKADNVLLTARENVKLADFGLVREYIALKGINAYRDDGSWIAIYAQYYMNSGVGPVHWVAPEVFTGRYSKKADVFSLGTLFYAILERDSIVIDGKAIYGAFVNVPDVGKLGLGLTMAEVKRGISISFSSHAQGSNAMQRVVLETLQYDKHDRPSAQEIYDNVMNIQGVKLNQQRPEAETGSCF